MIKQILVCNDVNPFLRWHLSNYYSQPTLARLFKDMESLTLMVVTGMDPTLEEAQEGE